MWRVGDRVEIVECSREKRAVSIKGTVIKIEEDIECMTVKFDKKMGGHDGGNGIDKDGYYWYFYEYSEDSEYIKQDGIAIRKLTSKKNNYW